MALWVEILAKIWDTLEHWTSQENKNVNDLSKPACKGCRQCGFIKLRDVELLCKKSWSKWYKKDRLKRLKTMQAPMGRLEVSSAFKLARLTAGTVGSPEGPAKLIPKQLSAEQLRTEGTKQQSALAKLKPTGHRLVSVMYRAISNDEVPSEQLVMKDRKQDILHNKRGSLRIEPDWVLKPW